ncbi:hypothetical protein J4479_02085 [Candidatus Woesearchaeota archaeon]|nr:hypothetical protein [Candidatus Woesearchaeota archaeon]
MSPFKFPSIKEHYCGETLHNDNLYVYEKVDGANVSIRREGFKIIPWSRARPIGRSNKYYFDQFRQFCFDAAMPEILELDPGLILFGEFTHAGNGHIDYGSENTNQFYAIGIFNLTQNRFILPEELEATLEQTELAKKVRSAPLRTKGEFNPSLADSLLEYSSIYNGPPEGLVIHEYGPSFKWGLKLSKQYHRWFQETDLDKKGVERYLTFRRFVKAGQKLLTKNKEVTLEAIIEGVVEEVRPELMSEKEAKRLLAEAEKRGKYIQNRILPLFRN